MSARPGGHNEGYPKSRKCIPAATQNPQAVPVIPELNLPRAVRDYPPPRALCVSQAGIGESAMYAKILVPVDGSQTSAAGLTEAIKIAKSQGSEIRLLHVVNDLILDYSYGTGVFACDALGELRKVGASILDT